MLLTLAVFLAALVLVGLFVRLLQVIVSRPRTPAGGYDADASRPTAGDQVVKEAAALIQSATQQADKIVREANFFSRTTAQKLHERLEAAATQTVQATQEELRELAEHAQQAVERHLAAYTERLVQHTAALERELSALDERERSRLQKELRTYQERRSAALEVRMVEALPELVREAAGRAIPLAEHEKLIREALTRAAQEGWQ